MKKRAGTTVPADRRIQKLLRIASYRVCEAKNHPVLEDSATLLRKEGSFCESDQETRVLVGFGERYESPCDVVVADNVENHFIDRAFVHLTHLLLSVPT
ncbi:MAG: hypothetical protein DMF63_00605 [Acidobacteria bacterium]|nr:MAG: hypothetical protein DMF63_00605 [Acidobacteriota bacterium]